MNDIVQTVMPHFRFLLEEVLDARPVLYRVILILGCIRALYLCFIDRLDLRGISPLE